MCAGRQRGEAGQDEAARRRSKAEQGRGVGVGGAKNTPTCVTHIREYWACIPGPTLGPDSNEAEIRETRLCKHTKLDDGVNSCGGQI